MSEIITKENERVVRLFGSLERMLSGIERLVANHRPTLGGERFLTTYSGAYPFTFRQLIRV